MRVKLVQRQRGNESVAAVVSERTCAVLFACVGPDAGGVLLAAVAWCREQRYTMVSDVAEQRGARGVRAA